MNRRDLKSAGVLGRYGGRPVEADEIRFAGGFRVARDAEAASWLRSRLLPLGGATEGTRVGAVIPMGFEGYARVLHPAGRRGETMEAVSWKEVAAWSGRTLHEQMQWEAITDPVALHPEPRPWARPPERGRAPLEIRRRLIAVLQEETTRPDQCWALVWTGWGGFEPDVICPDAPRVRLPGREYVLFRASLEALGEELIRGPGRGELAGPSVWWPEDQRWCVATEVDFCWTYVAGTTECVTRVLADLHLEALETRPDHRGDHASDTVNVRM